MSEQNTPETKSDAAGKSDSTPVNESARSRAGLQERVRGFRLATKYMTSGERYLQRRQEEAFVRRDTRWIDDTEKPQSTPILVGLGVGVIAALGCVVGAVMFPTGKVGDSDIIYDSSTATLYVKIGDTLSPTNLTSARLIVGSPAKPTQAKSAEIEKMPRGSAVGIPNAPEVRNSDSRDSKWAVCDTAATGSAVPLDPKTGLPTTATSSVKVTVIGGDLTLNPGTEKINGNRARLMSYQDQTWLIYAQGDQVYRSIIDFQNSVVTDALGIDPAAAIAPMSPGLFNTLDARQPLAAPSILELGKPVRFGNTEDLQIGTTLRTRQVDGSWSYYVAAADGIQAVSVPAAAVLQPLSPVKTGVKEISADKLAQWPKVSGRIAVDQFPSGKVDVIDTASTPITCFAWERNGSDPAATRTVFAGRTLPLTAQQPPVSLVSARGSQGTVADQAYMPANTGRYVQVTGTAPDSKETGGTFWIADTGVKYGIDDVGENSQRGESAASLGLSNPVLAPWNILSLFANGPTLSKQRALLKMDAVGPNPEVEAFVRPNNR